VSNSSPHNPLSFVDAVGQQIVLPQLPTRIVSLVPSLTETVIELGGGGRLVGCTDWCIHPKDITDAMPKVGGTKTVSVEKVLALKPDLVLANQEENRERHIAALREHVPVLVTFPHTVDDALDTVVTLGDLCDARDAAAEIARTSRLSLARAAARQWEPLPSACMIWREPWMVAGGDSYISDLMSRCGFQNVYAAEGRYPKVAIEDVIVKGARVILLPDEPFEFGSRDVVDILKAVPPTIDKPELVLLDGSYLTWYGTRTAAALEFLIDLRDGMATY
jgi:ABC-type Fe3+-hydroxamate transport system substrate-binding protein